MIKKIRVFILRKLKKVYVTMWRLYNNKYNECCEKDDLVGAVTWQEYATKYAKKYSRVLEKLLKEAAL